MCKIIESRGSLSAADSLPAGIQGDAQAECTSATDHQTLGSAKQHAQKPAKRQRTGASSISPGQTASGMRGADSQNGAPVSADKAKKGSGGKRVREEMMPGRELASQQEGARAAWELLQQLHAVAEGREALPEASCSRSGDSGGIRALSRVIDRLPGQHPPLLINTHPRLTPALHML